MYHVPSSNELWGHNSLNRGRAPVTPQERMMFLKRTFEMKIRFTKDELNTLNIKSRKSGLSREEFCRRTLNGSTVKEAPPADLHMLIQELRRVGSSLDRLSKLANTANLPEASQLREALEENRAVEKLIVDAYTAAS